MKKEGGRKPKRSERSEGTRGLILRAAARLFARHGFDRTSTETIAREAGVSQGIIFHYFETKRKLFWSVVFEGAKGDDERMKVFENASRLDDPAEKLRIVGAIMARRAEEYPDLTEILARHALSMDITPESAESYGLLKKMLIMEEVFDEGKTAGAFREDMDTRIAALSLVGIFNINYLKWNMLGRKDDLGETVGKAFDMFLSGVLTKNEAARR